MNRLDFKRKLTAILSADVAGYSRLMGEDEEGTVRTLNKYKKIIFRLIVESNGRLVDSPGDNVLAEFPSVVDAVRCAVQVQKDLKEQNDELLLKRKMEFRIGINIGDVIQDGERIYGDGVNVAARIESLADPGGICISRTAYDQVKNKIPVEYEYMGEYEVKNIKEPVRVYKALTESMAEEAIQELKPGNNLSLKAIPPIKKFRKISTTILTATILIILGLFYWKFYPNQLIKMEQDSITPEQSATISDLKELTKTIAVLPFENLSSDSEQEYFSDGLTEELINKLTQVKDLQVTARTSSFYFKGKNEDMRTIGEKLGVTYLLEGSVRKSGDQLRITAQLIKATDGYHLFSETYDRELKDIFTIQDEIAKAVTTALSITLGVGEFSRPGMTRSIEAYDEFLRAKANFDKYTPESILAAIEQFKKTLNIDPDFGFGWYNLSRAYLAGSLNVPPGETDDFKEKRVEAVKQARAIAPEMPELLVEKAWEYEDSGNLLEAERIYRKILDEQVNTNTALKLAYCGMLISVRRYRDAVQYLQRVKRQDPLDARVSFWLSLALSYSKRIEEALKEIKRSLKEGLVHPGYSLIEFLVALETNDRSGAAAIINANYSLEGDNPNTTMLELAKILLIEDKEAALSKLRDLSKRPDVPPNTRMDIAHVASALGDPKLGFETFMESEAVNVKQAIWYPIHRGIWQLPSFKTWIRNKGIYDYWRKSGNWGDNCKPVGEDDFVCE